MQRVKTCWISVLSLLVLTPPAVADGRRAGSLLVFPVHHSGPATVTLVSVTNTHLQPMTPVGTGGATTLHFEYVNTLPDPGQPTVPAGRTVFERWEFLTPGDTLCVRTACHDATLGPGQSGFLVVSAQDPTRFDVPWDHDWLIGSALVLQPSGGMVEIEALPFRALPGAGLGTDLDLDGRQDLDGLEYEAVPDVLFIDSFVATSGSRLVLLGLTGGSTARQSVRLDVWNDAGYALSTSLVMGCWFDQPLELLSPIFGPGFLENSTPDDPDELALECGASITLETGWMRIDSVGVFMPGGQALSDDGALLGCVIASAGPWAKGGRLAWELYATQPNGVVLEP